MISGLFPSCDAIHFCKKSATHSILFSFKILSCSSEDDDKVVLCYGLDERGGRGCGGVVSLFLFPLLLRRPSGWGYGSARVEAPIWKLLLVGRLKNKNKKPHYSMLSFNCCSCKTVISRLGQTKVMGCVLISLAAVYPYPNPGS